MTDFWKRRGMDTFQECIGGTFAITAQNFIELNVKRGQQWYITEKFNIGATGGIKDYYFVLGSSPAILKYRSISSNVTDLDYEVYILPTVSDPGTPVIVHNANGIYQETFLSSVFEDPSVTDVGILNERDWIPGTEGVGNRSQGAFASSGFEKIIPPNATVLTRFRNNGGSAGTIFYLLSVYEGQVVPLGNENVHTPHTVNDPVFPE